MNVAVLHNFTYFMHLCKCIDHDILWNRFRIFFESQKKNLIKLSQIEVRLANFWRFINIQFHPNHRNALLFLQTRSISTELSPVFFPCIKSLYARTYIYIPKCHKARVYLKIPTVYTIYWTRQLKIVNIEWCALSQVIITHNNVYEM